MSQYNIIPPKGKYTAVPQGYDTSYERFENLSDVGQGLGNILTGTMKGFGYDLEDPQSLLESLALSAIVPGPLKNIAKKLKFTKAGKLASAGKESEKYAKDFVNRYKDSKIAKAIPKAKREETLLKMGKEEGESIFLNPSKLTTGPERYSQALKDIPKLKGNTKFGKTGSFLKKLIASGLVGSEVVSDIGRFSTDNPPSLAELYKYIPIKTSFASNLVPIIRGPGVVSPSLFMGATNVPANTKKALDAIFKETKENKENKTKINQAPIESVKERNERLKNFKVLEF